MLHRLLLAAALSLPTPLVLGQTTAADTDAQAPAAAAVEAAGEEAAKTRTQDESDATAESPREFDPTEKISIDFAADFPADI